MLSEENILYIQQISALQPQPVQTKPAALICHHCNYVNETEFLYCTNCGYPLQNKQGSNSYKQRIEQRKTALLKAENAVLAARVVLYIIASFLSLGFFFIFAESNRKYIVVLMALLLSGLFFLLASWSRKNPFPALLTSFIMLIAFSTINIFRSLTISTITFRGITGILICLALLMVILRGLQGAYRISLIKEEL
ncbi:zinc ribbon domain-containing protein [Parafilimonas terrae]|jgi:hypothetical protein|uniref:Uncharacterized protein n=1 Tax=Parafilimonas terrae TaxID=1465490 RepID=A0A1I5SBR6_9BACT|nr:zinc ribbon domain-containing protein [Parafilimonas terrae]SFP68204.1 hypothetical protein SAMN05444277_101690 [Parafilimonas terrae]